MQLKAESALRKLDTLIEQHNVAIAKEKQAKLEAESKLDQLDNSIEQQNANIKHGISMMSSGKSIIDIISQQLIDAYSRVYDEIDNYIEDCMNDQASLNCSSKELRTWEADIVKTNYLFLKARYFVVCHIEQSECPSDSQERRRFLLKQTVPKSKMNWLNGRLTYLVGMQEEEKWGRDCLRFLSYYSQELKDTEYAMELEELTNNLRHKLEAEDQEINPFFSQPNFIVFVLIIGAGLGVIFINFILKTP